MQKALVNTLQDRISIVKMVAGSSATGAPTSVEEEVKSCRCSHNETNVAEEDDDGKVRALFSDVFVIRYDKQFTKGKANGWFVKDKDNLLYNIISVTEIVKKKYLQINTVRRE